VRKTYDLEGVGNDADSHELLSVVAAVHHEGVGQTLNDRALGLAETLLGVAAGGVRHVDGSADLDVVAVWSLSSAFAFPYHSLFALALAHPPIHTLSIHVPIRPNAIHPFPSRRQ
jgi:hypothetical protein